MKKIIIVLAIILLVASVSFAGNAVVSTTFSTKAVSQKGFLLHNNPVQQTNFFFTLPNGFYGNFWFSIPWNGENNFGKEVDYTIGWSGNLKKLGMGVDAGISYFDFIDLFELEYDLINPYLRLTKKIAGFEKSTLFSYVLIEHPFVTDSWDSGVYVYAGLKNVWNFSDNFSFFQDMQVLYDAGVFGLKKCFIGKGVLGGKFKVNDSVSINSAVTVFSPLTLNSGGRETETIFMIGVAYFF